MPREVVPIFRSPRRASDSRSRSRWYGRMRCALSLTKSRRSTSMPCCVELVDLGEQRLRIDHDAVADDAGDAGMQDAGRDQPQHELRAVDIHRVPGVVAALIARDDVEARRQQVDDLAFAFVAPLRAEHCEIHNRDYDSTSNVARSADARDRGTARRSSSRARTIRRERAA